MSVAALTVSDGTGAGLERELRKAIGDPECQVMALAGLDRLSGPPTETLLAALDACPLPVVAGLSGQVGAGGLLVAAACDVVVAEAGATLSLAGLAADQSVWAARLQVMLPSGLVRRMILLGETVSAEEVARLGAIQLAGSEGALAEIERMARELAAKSPTALRLLKSSIAVSSTLPAEEGVDLETLYSRLSMASPDSREAAQAFLEKRAPVWAAHRKEGQA